MISVVAHYKATSRRHFIFINFFFFIIVSFIKILIIKAAVALNIALIKHCSVDLDYSRLVVYLDLLPFYGNDTFDYPIVKNRRVDHNYIPLLWRIKQF